MLAIGANSEDDHSGPGKLLLRTLSGGEDGELTGHQGPVTTLASGTLGDTPVLLSGSEDNTIRLWDLRARRQIGGPTPGVPEVKAAAFTAEGGTCGYNVPPPEQRSCGGQRRGTATLGGSVALLGVRRPRSCRGYSRTPARMPATSMGRRHSEVRGRGRSPRRIPRRPGC